MTDTKDTGEENENGLVEMLENLLQMAKAGKIESALGACHGKGETYSFRNSRRDAFLDIAALERLKHDILMEFD